MTPLIIGYIGIALLIVLLFAGVHISLSMGVIGFLGIAYLSGMDAGLIVLKTVPFTTFSNYGLSVIPLFILIRVFRY